MSRRLLRSSNSDLIFDIANYGILSFILVLFIYPAIFILSASISDPNDVWSGRMWLFPKSFSFEGYELIFANKDIWNGYRNSLFYMFVGTALNVVLTLITSYPLSRKDFFLRGFLIKLYVFTMFFSGGLIPSYMLVRNLGMLNSIWAMVVPGAVAVFNVILTITYFKNNIPEELREAAFIDGSTNFNFFVRIVLPLSAPITAVIALFYGVGHWNSYFSALLYLTNRDLYPLQLVLREILVQSQMSAEMLSGVDARDALRLQRITELIKYGVIIVASLPVLIIYPFVQRYFVKGVMIGSLKG